MAALSNISLPCSFGFHQWRKWQGVITVHIPNWIDREKGTFAGHTISHRRERYCEKCYSRQEGEAANKVVVPADPDTVAWKPVATRRHTGRNKFFIPQRTSSDL